MNIDKKLVVPILILSLGILAYTPMTLGTHFTGPKELSSQAFKDLNIDGPSTLKTIKADSLAIKGPLNFNTLSVNKETEISGDCSGENGKFSNLVIHGTFWGSKIQIQNNLEVDGETALEDFNIKGNVTIHAPLKAKNGSFSNITAAETPIALYNVTVHNIHVTSSRKTGNSDNSNNNEIKLAGNTVVSGDITFDSGNGVVFIRDKTAILKGNIIGGKLHTAAVIP